MSGIYFEGRLLPGLVPAGDLLYCSCNKVSKQARPAAPALSGSPRSELPDRPASKLAFGSDNEAGLPRSDGPPLGGAEGDLSRAMDTAIPDRYAGENKIEMRPDPGHGTRRHRGPFLGRTKSGQMIDDKGVVDAQIVMGGSDDGKLSVL